VDELPKRSVIHKPLATRNKINMEVIESKWYKKNGASSASIDDIEKLLNTTLPKQYKSFLLWSNGGEGKLGDNYIYIWAIEDVIAYNHDYGIQKYLQKEYLAFGMDGDIGYILHLSDNSIYRVDLGDLDITSIKYIAPSFDDFLGKAIYLNFNKLQNVANNNLTT